MEQARVPRGNRQPEHKNQRNPLRKSLEVLGEMVDALPESVGVREIAQKLNLAPSTVHRILQQLEEERLIQSDPADSQYRLGLRFFRIASRAAARFPLSRASTPIMRELMEQTGETVVLALYDPGRLEMMYVAVVQSSHAVRYVVEPNTRWMGVYAGAVGLAIMAHLPKEEQQRIVARGLARITDQTITSTERLEQDLAQVHHAGYAITFGHRNAGAVGIGAPIWADDGSVIGSIGLTLPDQRFDPASEPRLAEMVMEAARRITEQVGGRPLTWETGVRGEVLSPDGHH